jgi:hypothetical protein
MFALVKDIFKSSLKDGIFKENVMAAFDKIWYARKWFIFFAVYLKHLSSLDKLVYITLEFYKINSFNNLYIYIYCICVYLKKIHLIILWCTNLYSVNPKILLPDVMSGMTTTQLASRVWLANIIFASRSSCL